MASQEIEMPAYNIRIQIPHDAEDDSGDDDLEEEVRHKTLKTPNSRPDEHAISSSASLIQLKSTLRRVFSLCGLGLTSHLRCKLWRSFLVNQHMSVFCACEVTKILVIAGSGGRARPRPGQEVLHADAGEGQQEAEAAEEEEGGGGRKRFQERREKGRRRIGRVCI